MLVLLLCESLPPSKILSTLLEINTCVLPSGSLEQPALRSPIRVSYQRRVMSVLGAPGGAVAQLLSRNFETSQ